MKIVVDLETTGFRNDDEIAQMATWVLDDNLVPVSFNNYYFAIKNEMPPDAYKVNGLSKSFLFEKSGGTPFSEYKEQFIEVFDDNNFEYMDLLLQLVEKIYNYFTRPYTEEENKLKSEFLNIYVNDPKHDLEEAIYDLREMYDKDKFEEIYYLMRVVYNQDENLSNIEGLTAENDWKHIILSHYNFETFVYYDFKNCFPDIVEEKPELAKQFDPDEAMFTPLDEDLNKYFEYDLFNFEKLRKDCREEYLKRVKKESTSKGGAKSKTNHTEPIKIKHKFTGKVLFFSSLESCAKHLKVGISTIWRFKQGHTKLNAVWEILE